MNTTDKAASLPLCKGFDRLCTFVWYEYLIFAVNIASIAINLFHMVILRRLPGLKGTKYLTVLEQIGVFDILCAVVYFVKVSCPIHHSVSQMTDWQGIIISILWDGIIMYRYSLLTIACAERFVAVCLPMHYETNIWIRHLKLWSVLIFLIILGLFIGRDIASMNGMCIHPVIGVMAVSKLSTIIFFLAVVVPSFLATLLISLVLWEIRRMKKRTDKTRPDYQQLKNSSTYVAIISFSFYVCFIPVIASIGVKLLKINTEYTAMTVTFMNSIYGIFNTLVYGWKNAGYRREIMSAFGCQRKNRQVNSLEA